MNCLELYSSGIISKIKEIKKECYKMSFLYIEENCRGTEIKFIRVNGEFLSKKRHIFGGVKTGTVALQDCGEGKLRITFCDLKNLIMAAGKDVFNIGKNILNPSLINVFRYLNSNSLCAFTFTRNDLKQENVVIKYQVQFAGLVAYSGLMCYDLRNNTGCSYLFDSTSNGIEEWAKEIGITEVEYLDASGTLLERKPIN